MVSIACLSICSASAFDKIPFLTRAAKATWIASKAAIAVGSNIFNFGLLLNSLLGVRPTLVPFTGAGPATNALLSGQVDYMCDGVPESGSHIQAGMLKAYAVGTAERNPELHGRI